MTLQNSDPLNRFPLLNLISLSLLFHISIFPITVIKWSIIYNLHSVQIEGGLPFVIKNDKGARFMAFDALELEFFTC